MRPAEQLPLDDRPRRVGAFLAHTLSDERLTRRIGEGDDRAFDELYRRYSRRLAGYGARLLGDRARGEDVAQQALLNAYQALRRGTEPEHVRPWLYRIAQNAALELLSRRQETTGSVELEEHAEDAQAAHAARGRLVAALQALPDRQRRAYLLREVHGLGLKEIAERLGLAVEQVEQALFAARNRLAEHLVFGERLTCDTVRALDTAALGRSERRALRGHLRSCASCRSTVSVGGLAGFSPLGWVAGLRDWLAPLFGGAAVPATKIGALVVATAVIGGAPLAAGEIRGVRHRHAAVAGARAAPAAAPAPDSQPAAVLFQPAFLRAPGAPAPRAAVPFAHPAATGRRDGRAVPVKRVPETDPAPDASGSAEEPATDDQPVDDSGADAAPPDDAATGDGSDSGTDPSPDGSAVDTTADATSDPAAGDPSATDPTAADPSP